MSVAPIEDGLHVVDSDDEATDYDARAAEDGADREESPADSELEDLRDAFVEAFNGRDLDALLALVSEEIETPDIPGSDGEQAFAEEVEAIWERSPEALLTRGYLDDRAVAVAWRPDEEGAWTRVALVCFDCADGELTLVALPEDVDGLDRTEAEEPDGDEVDEWNQWSEWERGEETVAPSRDRPRP